MKKLVLLLMTALMSFSLCGCNNTDPSESTSITHTHTFSEEWSFNNEYHWHDSTCGHDVFEAKEKHTLSNWIIDKEPTEHEVGKKHRSCAVCNFVEKEDIDKLPHVHTAGEAQKENNIDPSCTAGGSYDLVVRCTGCNEILSSEHFEVDALDHDYQVIASQEATYENEGYIIHECSRCHDVYTETIPKLKYKVEFDSQGGTPIDPQYVSHGDKVEKPKDPEKEGYTFLNWTYQGEVWSFIGYGVTSDMTLVANWQINSYKLVLDNSNPLSGSVSGAGTYNYDTEVTINATPNDGHEFDGWYENDVLVFENPKNTFKLKGDRTLTAKWKLGTLEFSIVSNDETMGTVETIKAGTFVGDNVEFNVYPTKGRDFYFTDQNGDQVYMDVTMPEEMKFTIEKPITWPQLYIYVWNNNTNEELTSWPGVKIDEVGGKYTYTANAKKYTSFIFNNGFSGQGNQTGDLQFWYYLFNGTWYSRSSSSFTLYFATEIDFNYKTTMPATDYHLTCNFVNYPFGVNYELYGGTNNEDNPSYYYYGDDITLKDPIMSGYKFLYWDDGNGNHITHLGDKTHTYYLIAVWEKL